MEARVDFKTWIGEEHVDFEKEVLDVVEGFVAKIVAATE